VDTRQAGPEAEEHPAEHVPTENVRPERMLEVRCAEHAGDFDGFGAVRGEQRGCDGDEREHAEKHGTGDDEP
jgi:hypothetical protein